MSQQQRHESKIKLLDAALQLIRTQGYAGTTVDDICRHAGMTKGSFFHHFKGKDDLALAAVAYWGEKTEALFASAAYHQAPDPLDRLLGYIDFRQSLLQGDAPGYTCLLGTLVQEIHVSHPAIVAACDTGLSRHVAELTRDLTLAKARYAPQADWSAESLGYFMQSVLQGGFIFSKAQHSPAVARESLAHLRRYLKALFVQQDR
jgi:TetR/AcrR family transcriptional regulator, transcriptional repressor for nem operon